MVRELKSRLSSRFIVLDGPDGCGKSTQLEMLIDHLAGQGVSVDTFRDPGTTSIGEQIRDILLSPSNDLMSSETEMLLYMAARSQLWVEKIGPALEAGVCVVGDRWLSSTCAYQGYAGDVGVEKVIAVAGASLERAWPDLTIILDVDVETSMSRLGGEPDRMEQKSVDYHRKVREGFLEFAKLGCNVAVIDAGASVEQVHKDVLRAIEETELI